MVIIEHELVREDDGGDWEDRYNGQMARVAGHLARAREMLKDQRHGFALLGTTPEGQLLLALETLLDTLYTPEEAGPEQAAARQPDAFALATANLLDQAAGVAELLQEAGDYIDDLLATVPLSPLVNREAGADLVWRIAQALGGNGQPEATCPDCGVPLLRRAGQRPLCPNDLCNYVAARIARGEQEHDRNSSAVSRGAQAGTGAGDRGWPDR